MWAKGKKGFQIPDLTVWATGRPSARPAFVYLISAPLKSCIVLATESCSVTGAWGWVGRGAMRGYGLTGVWRRARAGPNHC